MNRSYHGTFGTQKDSNIKKSPVMLSKKETGKVGEYRKLSKNHIQANAEKIRLRS